MLRKPKKKKDLIHEGSVINQSQPYKDYETGAGITNKQSNKQKTTKSSNR